MIGELLVARRLLSISDRVEISTGRKAGWSVRGIAAAIDRAPSVVSREIRRNSGTTSGYRAVTAAVHAPRRRSRPHTRKIDADPVPRQRVLTDVAAGRSPHRLTGRLGAETAETAETDPADSPRGSPHGQGHTVRHEAVHTWLYALPQGELVRHDVRLDSGRTQHRPRRAVGQRTGPLIGRRPIEDRPAEANDPTVPGHEQGDCVIGAAGATAAATLVERTTRFTIILGVPTRKNANSTAEALIDTITT